MNPVLQQALLSLVRWGLTLAAGWFVRKGIWTDANATEYVAAGSVALLGLGWSLWERYHSRVAVMTALAMPQGTTPAMLKAELTYGPGADPNTPPHQSPVLR